MQGIIIFRYRPKKFSIFYLMLIFVVSGVFIELGVTRNGQYKGAIPLRNECAQWKNL